MRAFLFLISALFMLQAHQPAAAAFAHEGWSVASHEERVLPARHADLANAGAQKRAAPSVRPSAAHALAPHAAQLSQPLPALRIAPAAVLSGVARLRPHAYDATGPPTA